MEFKTRQDYLRKVFEIEVKLKKRRNIVSAVDYVESRDKNNQPIMVLKHVKRYDLIGKGNWVLVESGASQCIIVLLYDSKERVGAVAHFSNPGDMNLHMPQIVQKMKWLGATDISSVMMGGTLAAGMMIGGQNSAVMNWNAMHKILDGYKGLIRPAKSTLFKNMGIDLAMLSTIDGKVVYAISNGENVHHIGEFLMDKTKSGQIKKEAFKDIQDMIADIANFYFSIFEQINVLLNEEEEEETESSEENVDSQEETMRKNKEHLVKIKSFEDSMEKFINNLGEKEKSFERTSENINTAIFLKELEFLFSAILDADDKMGNFFDYIGSVKPELQKEIFNLISSASMDYARFIDELKRLDGAIKSKKMDLSSLLKELEKLKTLAK